MKDTGLLINNSILYRETQKYYDKMLENYDIGYGQILFLMMIYENEGATMKQLSSIGMFDKGTITKGINKLESIGYVRLEENPNDKRSKLIYTTSKAKDIISRMYILRKEWWQKLTRNMSEDDQVLFNKLLDKVVTNTQDEIIYNDFKFYNIDKFNTVDYPSMISTKLYTGGCNLRCKHCKHRDLRLLPDDIKDISIDYIYNYLDSRKSKIDAICISGGEPLLHDLSHFLKIIKDKGFNVKIETNGFFPHKLKDLIDNHLVDYVTLNIKNSFNNYSKSVGIEDVDINSIKESINIVKDNLKDYSIKTSIYKDIHSIDDIIEILKYIKGAALYQIYNYGFSNDEINNIKEKALLYVKSVEVKG